MNTLGHPGLDPRDLTAKGAGMARSAIGAVVSILGGAVGAAVGVLVFRWIASKGYYAMILPGASLGLGVHLTALDRSKIRGVLAALAALALGLATEAYLFPKGADRSWAGFFNDLLRPGQVEALMIAAGGLFGYWWGKEESPWIGSSARARKPKQVKDGVE